MTRERSSRRVVSRRGDRCARLGRHSVEHRSSTLPSTNNDHTSNYRTPVSPHLSPRYRLMNLDNTPSAVHSNSNPQVLSTDVVETAGNDACASAEGYLYDPIITTDRRTITTDQHAVTSDTSATVGTRGTPPRYLVANECSDSVSQTLALESGQPSQLTNQQLVNGAITGNYSTPSHRDMEINANLTHEMVCSSDSPTSHNSSTVPILDSISDYIITELPRATESAMRHEQIMMMDNSIVSGYNNNESTADGAEPSPYPVAENDILACMSTEYALQRPRRGRRERQRRRRRRHRSRRRHGRRRSGGHRDDDSYVKPDCCSVLGCKICLAGCLQFKKVLVSFTCLGVVCVLIGIVLGVLSSPGNSFFTLSLMFVGLGVILLTMVLIGWKCTPANHQPCHMLFGLGNYCTMTRRNRRRRDRLYWYTGRRMNPEFRLRPPPPSYAAAMLEDRNELRHLDLEAMPYVPGSPPPSYKSHTTIERPGIHIIFPRNEEFPSSNPPTYRLRNPVSRPSLAIFNDSNLTTTDSQTLPSRFSVSSTTALVQSEQEMNTDELREQSADGIVNLSFNGADHTVDVGDCEAESSSGGARAGTMPSIGSRPDTTNRPTNTIHGGPTIRPTTDALCNESQASGRTTTDGSVQTDDVYPRNLSHSVAIILEDGNASTL